MRLRPPLLRFFSFIVVKVSLKNGSIVKWAEESEGCAAVRSRWGGTCPPSLAVRISWRLGSRVVGLRCNSTRQNVCSKWRSFIS